jgi:oligopeptide/dipeptide ABC transporter ATP-binding protein
LDIRGLKTYFYTSRGVAKAVDDVNLNVGKQETVGLVGESGCGKSTLGFSIMKLVPPPGRIVGGEILFKGEDLVRLTQTQIRKIRGKDISMIFQDPMTYLNPLMRVGDQIREVMSSHQKVNEREAKKRVSEVIETVALRPEVVKRYPHELSGGMQQRIIIAMALVGKPSLIIADEPSTALDVTVQAQILDLMRDLKRKTAFSLLLITHDLGVVAETADRVYVMYAGEIVEHADVFTLYRNPSHPYTAGLLESVLSIDEFKEKLVTINGVVPDLIAPPTGCRFQPRCLQAKKICHERKPPEIETESGHTVSCWLYG